MSEKDIFRNYCGSAKNNNNKKKIVEKKGNFLHIAHHSTWIVDELLFIVLLQHI